MILYDPIQSSKLTDIYLQFYFYCDNKNSPHFWLDGLEFSSQVTKRLPPELNFRFDTVRVINMLHQVRVSPLKVTFPQHIWTSAVTSKCHKCQNLSCALPGWALGYPISVD